MQTDGGAFISLDRSSVCEVQRCVQLRGDWRSEENWPVAANSESHLQLSDRRRGLLLSESCGLDRPV